MVLLEMTIVAPVIHSKEPGTKSSVPNAIALPVRPRNFTRRPACVHVSSRERGRGRSRAGRVAAWRKSRIILALQSTEKERGEALLVLAAVRYSHPNIMKTCDMIKDTATSENGVLYWHDVQISGVWA